MNCLKIGVHSRAHLRDTNLSKGGVLSKTSWHSWHRSASERPITALRSRHCLASFLQLIL